MGLRVVTRKEALLRKKISGKAPSGDQAQDDMLTTLAKYIPIPVLTGFTFLNNVLVTAKETASVWWFTFHVLGVFTVLFAYYGMYKTETPDPIDRTDIKESSDPVVSKLDLVELRQELAGLIASQKTKQIIIALVAFVGYTAAIGGPFAVMTSWRPEYGAIALVFATLFISFVVAMDSIGS
jgi:hypothetical protein